MLQSLHIRDLALIESAELRFDGGLNVLSGATGGGKSLIVTALKLLRGGRATGGLVRHGAPELRVDGEFALGAGSRSAEVRGLVARLVDTPSDDGSLLVTRIVDAGGRSKVRIDGRPATLAALRELCGHLLEIHGQGDARALMRPEIQSETLDAFAGTAPVRAEFAALLTGVRATRERVREAAGAEAGLRERAEFVRFQLAEMDAVGLEDGELGQLEDEHRVLAHLDRIREGLATALGALQDDEANAVERLARAVRSLEDLASIDRHLADAADLLAEAQMQIGDACRIAQSRLGDLDLDPARLGAVDDRLTTVRRALERFGPTELEFGRRGAELRQELADLDAATRSPEELCALLNERVEELRRFGRRLVRARRRAAPRFAAAIEAELSELGMSEACVRVDFEPELATDDDLIDGSTGHGPGGLDFAVRINPGEPFQSMRETASGGEMARIVLAVKKSLADQDRVPFVVFDEIDAEIGGRLGLQVGRKLAEVARHHQVLIVTHLPQVAAFADAHVKVSKRVTGGRTVSTVDALDGSAREQELAAMSAGDGADAAAIAEARRLVERARGSDSCSAGE